MSSYSILRGIFTVLPPPPTQPLRNEAGTGDVPMRSTLGLDRNRGVTSARITTSGRPGCLAVLSIRNEKAPAEFLRLERG